MDHEAKRPESDPRALNLDTGFLKLSIRSFFAILTVMLGVTVSGVFAWTRLASSEKVEAIADKVATVSIKVDSQDDKLSKMAAKQESSTVEVQYIRARIDFLVEKELLSSPPKESARAVSRVRSDARARGESIDPLAGIEVPTSNEEQ